MSGERCELDNEGNTVEVNEMVDEVEVLQQRLADAKSTLEYIRDGTMSLDGAIQAAKTGLKYLSGEEQSPASKQVMSAEEASRTLQEAELSYVREPADKIGHHNSNCDTSEAQEVLKEAQQSLQEKDWARERDEMLKKMDGITTDPFHPDLGVRGDDGQNKVYLVLKEDKRKGYIRPYRDTYVHTVCGSSTKMGESIAETYAANPKFYSSTYCCKCGNHYPVDEFTWKDSNEKVGS